MRLYSKFQLSGAERYISEILIKKPLQKELHGCCAQEVYISGVERYIREIFIKESLLKGTLYYCLEGGCTKGVYILGVERYISEIFIKEPGLKEIPEDSINFLKELTVFSIER